VEDLVASIRPHAHDGQDHLIHAAHFAPFVAALVDPHSPGGLQNLAPNAIDQQDRRRIGDRLGAPGVHGRLSRPRDAVHGLAREHVPKQDIQRLLQIADGEAERVEIESLIEQQWHRQLIAREHLPAPRVIVAAQFGHVEIGNKAVGCQYAARVGAGALECDRKVLLAVGLAMHFQFFDEGQFQRGLDTSKRMAAQMGG